MNAETGKVRVILLGTILCICGACIVLYWLRDRPVLVSLSHDVHSNHNFQILNPFRSRVAENRAEVFFGELQSSDCEIVLRQMEDNEERVSTTCSEELKFPIATWNIEAIGQDQGRYLLRYRVKRKGLDGSSSSPFWVWLSRTDGDWRVTGYETWY